MREQDETWTQCRLSKCIGTQVFEQVLWIPSRLAFLMKVIRIKTDDGRWDEGWHVINIGKEIPHSNLPDFHKLIRCIEKRNYVFTMFD